MKGIISLLVFSVPAALAAVPGANPAVVPATYPDHTITLVEPFAARLDFGQTLAYSASKVLGQKVVIESELGAGGANAAMKVRNAKPDGYTLLLGRLGSQIIQPAMFPETPYRWTDFTVLAILEIGPLVCAVRNDAPYGSARELLEAIRKKPGTLKYGTIGATTNAHLGVQYMLHLAGLKSDAAIPVHYENGAARLQALKSGEVQFGCFAGSVVDLIKTGELRALFSTAPGRLPGLPQLPNASEAGLRDMGRIVGWTALLGPRGMPPAVVARWKEALNKVSRDPEWLEASARSGGLPVIRTITDPEQFMRDQFSLYDQLVVTLNPKQ